MTVGEVVNSIISLDKTRKFTIIEDNELGKLQLLYHTRDS